ncbi:MAG: thioredoxin family protein [Planctomycetes bacterium]|nr:thioredoxin family protein [Planctomycetota bacterium]
MTSLTMAVVLQAVLGAAGSDSDSETYSEAVRQSNETGRPILVMVSADWCGACQRMKSTVIPQAKTRGIFSDVSFAVINMDQQRDLGRQLTGGGPIPQLVMYSKTADGWKRQKLVGMQSIDTVERFIEKGIAMNQSGAQENEASGTTAANAARARVLLTANRSGDLEQTTK